VPRVRDQDAPQFLDRVAALKCGLIGKRPVQILVDLLSMWRVLMGVLRFCQFEQILRQVQLGAAQA
jgi:hypothetical protein